MHLISCQPIHRQVNLESLKPVLQPQTNAVITRPSAASAPPWFHHTNPPVFSPSPETAHPTPSPIPISPSPSPQAGQSPFQSRAAGGFSGGSGGAGSPPGFEQPIQNTLMIQDVFLNGQSVAGAAAPTGIQANYQGKQVTLTVRGYFGDPNVDETAAVLNNGILLEVVSTTSEQIVLKLETGLIPDLYLSGPHNLRLQIQSTELRTKIRVGEPEVPVILFPQLKTIIPIKDSAQKLVGFQVAGQYFMRNPYFSTARIDSQDVRVESVTRSGSDDLLALPVPQGFDTTPGLQHTLSYATPFGSLSLTFTLQP